MLIEEDLYKNDKASCVDELCGFIIAGMFTIQLSTCNFMVLMENYPACKEKLLAEVIPVVDAVANDILGKLDYDMVMEFEYLHYAYNETLRILPPTVISGNQVMSTDVTFHDGFKLSKGDPFIINFYGMHHSPD